jgi:hypothetical protein
MQKNICLCRHFQVIKKLTFLTCKNNKNISTNLSASVVDGCV